MLCGLVIVDGQYYQQDWGIFSLYGLNDHFCELQWTSLRQIKRKLKQGLCIQKYTFQCSFHLQGNFQGFETA